MIIRKAKESDFQIVLELNREIQEIHANAEPKLFKPAKEMEFSQEKFNKIIVSPNSWMFVAEVEGSMISGGYIFAEVFEVKSNPYFIDYKLLYINHLGVHPSHKKSGIGTALLKHICDEAKKANIDRIEIDVWAFNGEVKAFYEKFGFRTCKEKLFLEP